MSQIDEFIKELNELRRMKQDIEFIWKPQYDADKQTIMELRTQLARLMEYQKIKLNKKRKRKT